MPFGDILLCLINGDVIQPFLIRLSVVDSHFFNGGQDDEDISIQFFGHQAAGKIFVDHRAGPF